MTGPAVVLLDREGRVTAWNEGAELVYGYAAKEVVGAHLGIFYADDAAARAASDLRVAAAEGTYETEEPRVRADGTRFRASVEITAHRDERGAVLGFTDVAGDVAGMENDARESRFLAEAGRILSSSLDYRETLAKVAHLVVPWLADWCVVDVLEEDGGISNVATAHRDPEKIALTGEWRERYPPDLDAQRGVPEVLRTGRPELVPEIPAALLEEAARDEEHRETLRSLELASYMVVPLAARGRMIGAITLITESSGRRYGPADLELAEDLAARAALAVDNARLYEEAQAEISERERTEAALREAEARKTAIMDASLDCIITMDDAGLITDFNPAAERTFGYRRAEVLGSELADVIIPPAFRDAHRRGLAHYLATGEGPVLNKRIELRGARADGGEFPVELTIVPIRVGGRAAFTGYLRDITERERAQTELREAERRYRALVEQMPAVTYVEALDVGRRATEISYTSPQIEDLFGYTAAEWMSDPGLFVRLLHPDDRERVLAEDERTEQTGEPFREEYRQFTRDGRVVWVRDEAALVRDEEGNPLYWQGVILDVTERRRAEEALRQSEERYRGVIERAAEGIYLLDAASARIIDANPAFCRLLGYGREEAVGMSIYDLLDHDREEIRRNIEATPAGASREVGERRYRRKDGSLLYVVSNGSAMVHEDRKVISILMHDVTERRQAEEALRRSERSLRAAQAMAHVGDWEYDLHGDTARWSEELFRIFGLPPGEPPAFRGFFDLVHPEDRADVRREVFGVLRGGEESSMDYRITRPDGEVRTVHTEYRVTRDASGRGVGMFGTVQDITDRRRAAAELETLVGELRRSNAELEQFAYVASHDLQEPLRMVSSFTQLLRRRYEGQLDATADEFIGYAVDGASRMQTLINALLEYSRVGTRGRPFTAVDAEGVFAVALANLRNAVGESGAEVVSGGLPVVFGDEVQLMQLFQNLIANAIKFRGEERPLVRVEARRRGREWVFSVKDNGIGIGAEYRERIFVIFQRLHGREEFSGTGIGLALCKKIVERHGGKIWVESEPGRGSTFYFTLAPPP